jgi:hypothetical protein
MFLAVKLLVLCEDNKGV